MVDLAVLTECPDDHQVCKDDKLQSTEQLFYPFPNRSSFELSKWYWNDGSKKSKSSFRNLIHIVGNPDFRPEDVQITRWDKINKILGQNDFNKDQMPKHDDSSFLAKGANDAGWRCRSISIQVPFHSCSKDPGPKSFLVRDFYHRSLIDVLCEKLGNYEDDQHFHYQPYELCWQPQPDVDASERVVTL